MKLLPIEIENFKELIDRQYYFVDKSDLISDLTKEKIVIYTRPRRFGKTLMLSMLYYFFSVCEQDNAYLFRHLKIADYPKMMQFQNQYPVIFISMKDLKNRTYEMQIRMFSLLIQEIAMKFSFLTESDALTEIEKKRLNKLLYENADESELQLAIKFLTQCLCHHFHKKVILLIDEYDVPLQSAYLHRYYDKMVVFLGNVVSSSLKTNDYLEKGILTGCLRIARESIFTGLNNFTVYSVLDETASNCFGFTQDEVNDLLSTYQLSAYSNQVKSWYNGYLFGNTEIYNPWSVLKYVNKLLTSEDKSPSTFWGNTSSNDIVYQYIQQADQQMKSEFEELIKGKSIVKHIKQDLTYRDMDDIQNIYSFMLMTGYLKAIGKEGTDHQICLPNLEVHEIFKNTFVRYFQNFTSVRRNDFVHCLKQHDVNQAQSLLNQMLYHSLSYFDNHENFYHGFLVGLLQGYHIKSNREAGDGRFDLVIYGETIDDPCIVIECKHSEIMRSLKVDSERAARQIIDKRYIDEILDEGYLQCIGYGIAFCKKSCLITSVSSLT